jgi:bidirectional [NiFe] hydrogenase diaphorase subunit
VKLHRCVVCTGTACYVKGAGSLLTTVEKCAKIHAGETTPNGELSFSIARCLGACGIAPAVVFDGTVCGHQTPELVTKQIARMAETWISLNYRK